MKAGTGEITNEQKTYDDLEQREESLNLVKSEINKVK